MTLDLPLVVNGTSRWPADGGESYELRYENGLLIRVPKLTDADVDAIEAAAAANAAALAELTIFDVTDFLSRVGRRWLDGAPGRRFAEEHAPALTGYPREMLQSDYHMIGSFIRWRAYLYDQVAAEFGSERFFDEWTAVQASWVRGFPRGLVLHYLVGNLPLASIYTLIRGFVTGNRNLAKLPTRDPVSPIGFVQTLQEVGPDHPITRSVSVAYWPHDAAIGQRCLSLADAVCVWGGAEAVEAVKRATPAGVPVSEFGPRWSASVVDLDACDPERAAFRLAADVSFYDQEACFSTQRAFVAGDVEAFRPVLAAALDRFAARMPLVTSNRDVLAHRSLVGLDAEFMGWDVDRGHDWQVIVADDPAAVTEHPLGRTLFLHPVDDLASLTRWLDRRSQTLGVFPWSLIEAHRDAWARAGVDRLVELGMSRHPRHGFTHDGMRSLHQLVRIVSVERAAGDFYKYGDQDPAAFESRMWVTD
jgi:long-chain-fatty-acyl-CoA reductase